VQLRHELRLAAGQLGAQVLGEQVVIAIGQPVLVERHHEQVAALQFAQHDLRIEALGQRVAQWGGQFLEHAGLKQEGDDVRWLARQNVLGQEVGDVPTGAGEPIDEVLGMYTLA
jgi:hypothetical protein